MLKNYLLVTFRNLLKNRIFTLINITGLGIGLAVCIVAFFNHMFNYNFDRTHENFNEIYRVTSFRDMKGREQEYGLAPATLGLEVKKDIPGIDHSARLIRTGSPVKLGTDLYPTQIAYVDPEFFEIFTFIQKLGDIKSVSDQANVVISQTMADKLFGKVYPVGKTISIINDSGKEFAYNVSAVFEDMPFNSSFQFEIYSHFDNFLRMWDLKDTGWQIWANALFIQVPDRSVISSVYSGLKNYIPVQNIAREDFKVNRFTLVPLDEVGENTRTIWSSGLMPSLHPAALIAPSVMALFILLIACFNFANTSIAIFSKRLKEIGLRKTFGSHRRQLVTQFMLETLIICSLALFTGILIAEFLVPAYSSLWEYMSLRMTFTGHAFFWIFLCLLLLLTGFISGVYPALYVSSFNPVNVLKGTTPFRGSGKISSVLLTIQFAISVTALVMGIVFTRNAAFQNTIDLGYDKDNVIIVPVPGNVFTAYRNEVLTNPKVLAAEGTSNHIGYGSYRRPVKDEQKQIEVDVFDIGSGYGSAIGLRLAEGRLFDETRAEADRSGNSIVITRKMVKDFGWESAVGRSITLYDTTRLNIIGVVEDFYKSGVWQAIEPTMFRVVPKERYGLLAVRVKKEDMPMVLEFLTEKWKSLSVNSIFGGRPQDELMEDGRVINDSIMKVNIFLAIVASILSLIGMYNLVSLDIIRRTKEIGIRKIQGAPVPLLMYLVSRKFLLILGVSSVIGCVGGYYMSVMLLDSIWDYFVEIKAGMMIAAVLIMLVATSATITMKILRAALRNPVDSLRYE
jgi:ABC-type antimicrobial peptide transport system permease subunit